MSHPPFDTIQGKGRDELAKLDAPDMTVTLKRNDGTSVTYKFKKDASGNHLFASSAHEYVFRVAEGSVAAIVQAMRSKLVQEKGKPEKPQASQSSETGGSGG